ncbi:MAG: cell envelope integrity protein CreD [Bacteroides sp.]|nr:cell envelope integrity protein CreD [Bacteroides sp.]MCM1413216.1 cell envelope integrity protein CreD [Bacteroides sp.]MCM1471474.1 cell envelope integrity protein CreD [Bacteroides sp.]
MTPDDTPILPPPIPSTGRRPISYSTKVIILGLICGVLMIGTLSIWGLSSSRESTNKGVAASISGQWGQTVIVRGPTIESEQYYHTILRPVIFDCQAEVATESLHRGIYEAEVFTANIKLSGTFDRDTMLIPADGVLLIDVLVEQIVKLNPLKIGNKEIQWQTTDDGLTAKIDFNELPSTIDFSTDLKMRGSIGLFVKPVGATSTITISGTAPNPSFDGYNLPIKRTQTDDGRFSAQWVEYAPKNSSYQKSDSDVGTFFLVGIDRYQKVERSLKYSFLFIVLTFIAVLFVEIMRKQPIPLLNYFLIGAALILFYSLLLSFAELIPFGFAYLIAAVMTVALITGYMWKMLRSRKFGLSIGMVLALLYLFLYIMLSISTCALLLGSLLLFISLAAIMYASLKLSHS